MGEHHPVDAAGDALQERHHPGPVAALAQEPGRLGRVLVAAHPAQAEGPAVEPLPGVPGPGRAGPPVQAPRRRPQRHRLGRHHLRGRPGHTEVVPELVDDDLVLQPPPLRPPGPVDPPAGDLGQLVEHRAEDQRLALRVPPVEGVHHLALAGAAAAAWPPGSRPRHRAPAPPPHTIPPRRDRAPPRSRSPWPAGTAAPRPAPGAGGTSRSSPPAAPRPAPASTRRPMAAAGRSAWAREIAPPMRGPPEGERSPPPGWGRPVVHRGSGTAVGRGAGGTRRRGN